MSMNEFPIKEIVRTKRNSVSINIDKDATVTIRAPLYLTDHQLESVVIKKQAWIQRKLVELAKRPQLKNKQFIDGEGFWFLGKLYKLKTVADQAQAVELKEELCVAKSALPKIKEVLMNWYRQEALIKLNERCAEYAKRIGVAPVSIKISNAQKRWGSCGPRGTINFNWRLIMAPLQIIDYIVVHELAHLIERNHSRRFWARVSTISPDYRQHKHWLKENEHLLVV